MWVKTFLTAMSVALRLLALLITNKVLALAVGPAGFALVGQLTNLMTIANGGAGLVANSGVVKLTAQRADDSAERRAVGQTAGGFSMALSLSLGGCLVLAAYPLARYLLLDATLWWAVVLLGVTLAPRSLYSVAANILVGVERTNAYLLINIFGALLGAALTAALALAFELPGALIAVLLAPLAYLPVFVLFEHRRLAEWLRSLIGRINLGILKQLVGFSAVALVTAASVPLAQSVLRHVIIGDLGLAEAGIADAMMRLSLMIYAFVNTALGIQLLPIFAKAADDRTAAVASLRLAAIALVPACVCALLLLRWRTEFAVLLFSADFSSLGDVMLLSVWGDGMRALSVVFSLALLARGALKRAVAVELGMLAAFAGTTVVIGGRWGLSVAGLATLIGGAASLLGGMAATLSLASRRRS